MNKTYKSNVVRRDARPRSKRLRESGQSVSSNVSITINGAGGTNEGNGHIHSNFSTLESLSADDKNYVYRTIPVEAEGDQVTLYKEKIKAGYADKAGGLDDKLIEEVLRKIFLSKDRPDETAHLLKMLGGLIVDGDMAKLHKGAQYGESFAGGLTGYGGRIDGQGRGELRSLRLWESLEVPELRYNQVKVFVGIDWQCAGAGIVESVTQDKDAQGNILSTGTVKLKLEKGQYGAIAVDDIVMGIYHLGDSRDATADSDDSKGNFKFAGFATIYFRITEVIGANNGAFKYSLRPGFPVHPQPQMSFACYGNFTNPERQTSTYRTRTYTRRLWKQNTWEIGKDNIAAQDGDLSNLSVHGMQLKGYSAYLNNIYFNGTLQQLKRPDGTTIKIANDRGKYVKGERYNYYDRVSHNGSLWLCINEKGTDLEPSKDCADWLQQVNKGTDVTASGEWREGMIVPKSGIVTMCGKAFIARGETTNPPLWAFTDERGNKFVFSDGSYVLTGEVNTTEYMLLVENGNDGNTKYTWIRYADDAQGNGISNNPDGKDYIGLAHNKDTEKESNNPADYVWSKIRGEQGLPGLDGLQGEKGEQGIPGTQGADGKPGTDGKTSYFHIKYSPNPTGIPMQETPAAYIGTYVDFTEADSSDPQKYGWAKFEGIDGKDGIPGKNGADGKTSYLHIAYATSADGSQGFDIVNAAGKTHIGQYTDFIKEDSLDYTKYKWSLIKGTDGVPGKPGADGKTYYTWVAYSDNANGNPMYQVPHDSTKYIGIAVNKETREESTNPADYVWSLFKGADGQPGADGKPGQDGAPGVPGIQGCIIRDSEWSTGVEYRNDENLTKGTRFIDITAVPNAANEVGYDFHKCILTHTSSEANKPGTTGGNKYWVLMSNVGPIFTSLLIAKNAKIKFLQGNQLLIAKSDGSVTAGLSGSSEGDKTRIWAGGGIPDTAPFAVNEAGVCTAEKFQTGRNGCRLEAANGEINIFGKMSRNIQFGVNAEGMAVLKYFDNAGNLLYDLGPEGLQKAAVREEKWVNVHWTFLSTNKADIFGSKYDLATNPVDGTYYFKYISRINANVNIDPDNDGRHFVSRSKTQKVPDGWYVKAFDHSIPFEVQRFQWASTSYQPKPPVHPDNPRIDTTGLKGIYWVDAFRVAAGLVVESQQVFYNWVDPTIPLKINV